MTLPELRSEYESSVIGVAVLEEVRRACPKSSVLIREVLPFFRG